MLFWEQTNKYLAKIYNVFLACKDHQCFLASVLSCTLRGERKVRPLLFISVPNSNHFSPSHLWQDQQIPLILFSSENEHTCQPTATHRSKCLRVTRVPSAPVSDRGINHGTDVLFSPPLLSPEGEARWTYDEALDCEGLKKKKPQKGFTPRWWGWQDSVWLHYASQNRLCVWPYVRC